jgi:hypothetical protein
MAFFVAQSYQMSSKFWPLCIAILFSASVSAQKNTQTFLGIEGSKGNDLQYSVAVAYNYIWLLGKQQKFEIGTGARMTYYSGGTARYFLSAPASIVSQGSEFIDTVQVNSPSLYCVNLLFNLGYRLTNRFSVGMNIDIIGVSFGNEKLGTFIGGATTSSVPVKPTPFNLLLGNNNDHGNLNSNFFVRYKVNENLAVKAGVQHLFTEYSTSTKVQQVPSPNDRFRYKSTMFSAGILFYF